MARTGLSLETMLLAAARLSDGGGGARAFLRVAGEDAPGEVAVAPISADGGAVREEDTSGWAMTDTRDDTGQLVFEDEFRPRRPRQNRSGGGAAPDVSGIRTHPAVVRARALRKSHGKGGDGVRYPVHLPIIPDERFRGVLSGLASSLGRSASVDAEATVRRFARAGRFAGFRWRQRRAIRGGIVLILDETEGMTPFYPDLLRFRDHAARMIGKTRVFTSRFRADGSFEPPKRWPKGGAVIVLSDLHGFVQRESRAMPGRRLWREIMEAAAAQNMSVSALVPARPEPHPTVPRAAFPDLFEGQNAAIKVVPWHDTLDRRAAAVYSAGAKRPHFEEWQAGIKGNAQALLDLLALVNDVEFYTLRTLRKCLSSPDDVAAAYNIGEMPLDRSLAGRLGPFHEHRVWTEPLFAVRSAISRFAHEPVPSDLRALRGDRGRFVRRVISDARAVRGGEQVIGDEYRWVVVLQRDDEPVAVSGEPARRTVGEARSDSRAIAQSLARSGDSGAIRRIFGRDISRGALGSGERLTLRITATSVFVRVNDPNANIVIPTPPELDLSKATLALYPMQVDPDAESHAPLVTASLADLPFEVGFSLDEVQTGIVTSGDFRFGFSLKEPEEGLEPLFKRNIDGDTSDLRMDGPEFVCAGMRFDGVGLAPSGPARAISTTAVHRVPDDAGSDWHPRVPAALRDQEYVLTVQRDPGRRELFSADIPRGADNWEHYFARSGPGGAILHAPNEVWVYTDHDDGDDVSVTKWIAEDPDTSPQALRNFDVAAASGAGAVLLQMYVRKGQSLVKENELVVLPPATERDAPPAILPFPKAPKALALSREGWLGVAASNQLTVYAINRRLGTDDGNADAFMSAAAEKNRGKLSLTRVAQDERRWHGRDAHKIEEMIDRLASEDVRALLVLSAEPASSPRLAEDRFVESALQMNGSESAAFAALCNRDSARLEELIAESPALAEARFGAGRWTLLHAASALQDGTDLVRALLAAHVDPDIADGLGRTPLMFAPWCDDHGAAVSALLNANADPTVEVGINGYVCGPLPDALSSIEKMRNPVAHDVIERLLAANARVDVFDAYANRTSLLYAASRTDSSVFFRVLDLALKQAEADDLSETLRAEAVRDLIDMRDRVGWTALTVACWRGLPDVVDRLLKLGADPFLGPDKSDALVLCVQSGFDEIFRRIARDPTLDRDALDMSLVRASRYLDGKFAEKGSDVTPHAEMLAELHRRPQVTRRVVWRTALPSRESDVAPSRLFKAAALKGVRLDVMATLFDDPDELGNRLARLMEEDRRDLIDWSATGEGGLGFGHLIAAGADTEALPRDALATVLADTRRKDANGFTPLHYAVAFGNAPVARRLFGADPRLAKISAADGRLPGDMAIDHPDGMPDLPHRTPEGVEPALPPRREMLALTVLPPDTGWTVTTGEDRLYFAAADRNDLPLSPATGKWRTLERRETELPYVDPVKLRETWLRKGPDTGVLVEFLDADGAILFRGNGTSPPIHMLNAERGIRLETEAAVRLYLVLFCACVHGEGGPFTIVSTEEVYRALRLPPRPEVDPAFGIRLSAAKDGVWNATALVHYAEAIFQSEFRILPTGMVEMLSDKALATEVGRKFELSGLVFHRSGSSGSTV